MKETKRQRKLQKGMNSATAEHYRKGYAPPQFAGKDGMNIEGMVIPAYAKIGKGTPYVNPKNFGLL